MAQIETLQDDLVITESPTSVADFDISLIWPKPLQADKKYQSDLPVIPVN